MGIESFSDPVFDAIKIHLDANWTYTHIQYPFEEYEPSGEQSFVKVELHGTFYGQVSIGANEQADNRWDHEGMLWLFLTVPRGSGAGVVTANFSQASGAAKALADIFRGKRLLDNQKLEFGVAKIDSDAWNNDGGGSHVLPVSIEWRHWDA
jgi:hypothetical protein